MADITFSRNVAKRITILIDASGPTTIDLDEIADPVTGAAISVFESDGITPVSFPDALTQTPGNDLSWYTQVYVINVTGDFVADFNPDAGTNFSRSVEVTTAGGLPVPGLNTCDLEDHIVDVAGSPLENVTVAATILATPYIDTGAGISSEVITSVTDSNGFFSLTALQGATLDVIIPAIAYRRTIVVPSASQADLFSIATSA